MTTINTQPLMTNQHLHYPSGPRFWFTDLKKKVDPWDYKALGINIKNLHDAYMVANDYGYNFDNILNYLIDQSRIRTDRLEFTMDPNHYRDDQANPKQLNSDLIEFGHQIRLRPRNLDQLTDIQMVAGICTVQEFLDAVTYQITHNPDHAISLIINQNDDIQKVWRYIQNNTITGDYPKLHVASAHDVVKGFGNNE